MQQVRAGSRLGIALEATYNTVLDPLARALAPVHPTVLTTLSVAAGCLAGVAFWATRYSPSLFFVGAGLGILSGVSDSLDGMVARISGRASAAGDFLDHFGDRVVEVVVLWGLAASPYAATSFGLAITLVALLNSYIGTQVEASFGHRPYTGPGKAEFVIGATIGTVTLGFVPDAAWRVAGRTIGLLDLLFGVLGLICFLGIVHRLRLAMRLAREAEARRRGSPDHG